MQIIFVHFLHSSTDMYISLTHSLHEQLTSVNSITWIHFKQFIEYFSLRSVSEIKRIKKQPTDSLNVRQHSARIINEKRNEVQRFSEALWMIHYTNITLVIAHCLGYVWHTRRFGNCLYSLLQVIGCHYTDIFLLSDWWWRHASNPEPLEY